MVSTWDYAYYFRSFQAGNEANGLSQWILEATGTQPAPVIVEIRNNAQLVIRANHSGHRERSQIYFFAASPSRFGRGHECSARGNR